MASVADRYVYYVYTLANVPDYQCPALIMMRPRFHRRSDSMGYV